MFGVCLFGVCLFIVSLNPPSGHFYFCLLSFLICFCIVGYLFFFLLFGFLGVEIGEAPARPRDISPDLHRERSFVCLALFGSTYTSLSLICVCISWCFVPSVRFSRLYGSCEARAPQPLRSYKRHSCSSLNYQSVYNGRPILFLPPKPTECPSDTFSSTGLQAPEKLSSHARTILLPTRLYIFGLFM